MIMLLENPAAGKYVIDLKKLHVCNYISLLSDYSALIKYCFITMQADEPLLALLSGHIEILNIIIGKLYFSPSNLQY